MPTSLDPTYPLFPIMSFLGFILALVPFSWHLQAWNAGTCAFMIWTSLACLVEFINCLVWKGSLANNVPVWCDISTKFLLGAGVGITASTLCISRRLYRITAVQNVSVTHAGKRRAVIIDLCIAVGIPFMVMALHYIVQPHRYDILEDIGCISVVYNTLPAYFLVFMWPVLLGVISFIYSAFTFRAFWNRRIQLAQLVTSHPSLSMSRYIRLMMLSVVTMLLPVPLGAFSIWFSTAGVGLAPWISWEDTHFNFSRVVLVPALIWRSDPWFTANIELTRWLFVASAFVFFAMFGFASEAQKHYRAIFWHCARPLGYTPTSATNSKLSSLPSWRKPVDSKMPPISKPIYVSTPFSPSSLKASRFSLTSTDDATIRGDCDLEKSKALSSPPIEPCPRYIYPPSTQVASDISPNPSLSSSDSHWPRSLV